MRGIQWLNIYVFSAYYIILKQNICHAILEFCNNQPPASLLSSHLSKEHLQQHYCEDKSETLSLTLSLAFKSLRQNLQCVGTVH